MAISLDSLSRRAPLEDIRSAILIEDTRVLLSDLELHVSDRFAHLVLNDMRKENADDYVWHFFDPIDKHSWSAPVHSRENLRETLSNDRFLSDYFFSSGTKRLAGYMSARDDLSVFVCDREIASQDDEDVWDREFALHIATCGIGFGEAGYEYARRLISQLPQERRALFKPRHRTK